MQFASVDETPASAEVADATVVAPADALAAVVALDVPVGAPVADAVGVDVAVGLVAEDGGGTVAVVVETSPAAGIGVDSWHAVDAESTADTRSNVVCRMGAR